MNVSWKYATVGQINTLLASLVGFLNNKATKATTLSGYGITDAYTKTEASNAISSAAASTVDKTTFETFKTEFENFKTDAVNNAYGESLEELGLTIKNGLLCTTYYDTEFIYPDEDSQNANVATDAEFNSILNPILNSII